jgi:hypothetical protein
MDTSLSEQVRARGEELRDSHSKEEIEKAIVEVEKQNSRESAVTVDILSAMLTGK